MRNYLEGRSVIVTGAGGGFGRLVSCKAAALGARVTCVDINLATAQETASLIDDAGGTAQAIAADVADIGQMREAAAKSISAYGGIDIMVNNAGVMPLAMYADHQAAIEKWAQCIDINIKGVLNGIVCVYDQMISQGAGHVVNISSIYGNYPVIGAGVYGASKAAVNYLSESLRIESRGKIKVTIIKPTGVPGTGLGAGVVNPEAVIGIVGHNAGAFMETMGAYQEGGLDHALTNPEDIAYVVLDPEYIADETIHAMNQPWGISLGDVTIRAAGDHYIL